MRQGLAYTAGFFDGEGSVGVYKNGRGTYHLRTQLVQNVSPESIRLLETLVSKWGGNGSIQTTKATGKKKYNWQLNARKAAAFLRDILPFSTIKEKQIRVALLYIEGRIDGKSACKALKNLKKG